MRGSIIIKKKKECHVSSVFLGISYTFVSGVHCVDLEYVRTSHLFSAFFATCCFSSHFNYPVCVCVCACVKRFSRCTTMKTLLKTRSSGYLFSIHLFRCQALLIVGYWSQMLASNKCEKKTTSDKRKLTHRNAGDIFICHNNIGAVRSSMFDIFHVRHSHVDRIQILYCNMGISIVFWYIDSICENSSQCIKRPGNSFYSISKAYG